jgi:hypothetical protein
MMIPSARSFTLRVSFPIECEVYLKARPETLVGYVTGFLVRPSLIVYLVGWGDATESNHFDFELTEEKPPP